MEQNISITVLALEFYNYGAMLIAGILKDLGYNVKLQKGFKENITTDVVFISIQSTIHLLKYQKDIERIDGFKIIGGPVSQSPELIYKYLNPDLVVVGEGESIINDIIKIIEHEKFLDKNSLKRIKGIAFKEEENIIINEPQSPITLNERSLPLIPDDISSESIRGANVYIETHRGCPGNCGFCQVPSFFGRDIRSRPMGEILLEVKEFLKKGARRIAISGGTGTLYGSRKFRGVDENKFIELIHEISKLTQPENLTIPDIRVDMISEDILEAIQNYTNGWIFFGIESGSENILKSMKKGITLEQIRNSIELARSYGVKVAGSFIVGYPGETEEDFDATLDLADELMLDDYFVSIAEPIPGTSLSDQVIKMPLEENPVFMESSEYKNKNLSVAEARALKLMMDSYIFRSFPVPMSDQLFNTLLKEVKSQGMHIKTVTKMIKKLI
ncbi:MAG: methyl-coenzyme M reductase glutamine C-methyltransferase [Methanobacteriaceae archaeon]